jgi:3-oxoacyl-[acyl-carrier protein] reductase
VEIRNARAVVTGAASGLGYTFALELAREGAAVVAGDIDEEGLARLAAEGAGLPGRISTARVDVADEASVREFVEGAFGTLGMVNALVNNAGVLLDGLLVKREAGWVRKLPTAQWQRVLDVNLTGSFLAAREVAAGMLERRLRNCVIVNISSLVRGGNEGQSAYAASKAGLDAVTRTWAAELAPYGIRVGAIAPGLVDTPILQHVSDEAKEALIQRIPLRRLGTTREIWLALRFIMECDFFNGKVIEVDGGAVV